MFGWISFEQVLLFYILALAILLWVTASLYERSEAELRRLRQQVDSQPTDCVHAENQPYDAKTGRPRSPQHQSL